MIRSLFRQASALLAGFAAIVSAIVSLSAFAPVEAATITYSDPNCASFSVSGGGGTYTLTCAKLACSIASSAGVNIYPLTAPTTLIATCNPAAVTHAWSIPGANPVGCPVLGANGTPTMGLTGTGQAVSGCVYQVDATANEGGLRGQATIYLNWSSAPLVAPANCAPSIATVPTTLTTAGGTANLNVTGCTPAAGLTYAWSKNGAANWSALQAPADNLPPNTGAAGVTTSYQVTVCNGGACTSPLPATPLTATVPGTSLPPPGGTCTIGTRTFTILDMGLQPFTTASTTTAFGGGNIAISTLLVPAGYLTTTNTITVFEYGSSSTPRHAWLSKTRCDQAGGSVLPAYPAYLETSGPVFNYSIGGTAPANVNMLPGETWYLHVTNQKPFGSQLSSCSGLCNIGVRWNPPN